MKAALMVLFVLMLLSIATVSPVLAVAYSYRGSAITCKTVRSYVSQMGLARATAAARARGMTAAQERQARQCLKRAGGSSQPTTRARSALTSVARLSRTPAPGGESM